MKIADTTFNTMDLQYTPSHLLKPGQKTKQMSYSVFRDLLLFFHDSSNTNPIMMLIPPGMEEPTWHKHSDRCDRKHYQYNVDGHGDYDSL